MVDAKIVSHLAARSYPKPQQSTQSSDSSAAGPTRVIIQIAGSSNSIRV